MKPIHLLFFALMTAMTLTVPGQNTIDRYEYWFDENFAGRTVVDVAPVSPLQVATGIPTAGLPAGLHAFHIRFRDANAKFSHACSQYFHKVPAILPGGAHVVAYEYWFDNNTAGKVTQVLTPQGTVQVVAGIPAVSLTDGVHAFHIRFKDDQNAWTGMLSQFFCKQSVSPVTGRNVVAYEYWFDNNYTAKITQTITPQNQVEVIAAISATSMDEGMHALHIRFKDDQNSWSGLMSQFFLKTQSGSTPEKHIIAYEYWFDNNLAGKTYQAVPPQSGLQLITDIQASTLTNGLHLIHIRFLDDMNAWSSEQSHFFQKITAGVISNKIYGYRYWFDSDLATLHPAPVTPPQSPCVIVDSVIIPMIPTGNHTISFQFWDSTGRWSSAVTDTFHFVGPIVNRTVSSYTIGNGETSCVDALEMLTVGGSGTGFTVQGGGAANLVAGLKIRFLPNTTVHPGGYLHGHISPSSPYCLPPSTAPVLKEVTSTAPVDAGNISMVIYPNPTNDQFTVRLTGMPGHTAATLKIFTAMGVQIHESTVVNGRWPNISLSQCGPGIYLVQVVQGSGIFTGKVIKQ